MVTKECEHFPWQVFCHMNFQFFLAQCSSCSQQIAHCRRPHLVKKAVIFACEHWFSKHLGKMYHITLNYDAKLNEQLP
jgi:hypothetical protein